jgi:hypothetical protein
MPVKYDSKNADESANFISSEASTKYFILHQGQNTYAFNGINVDKNKLMMSGKLSAVDPSHLLYIHAKKGNYKYKSDNADVLNEIHIYVNNNKVFDTINTAELLLSQVEKIEVIQHDKKRTTSSYVLGGLGIGIGAMVVAGIIIALTKDSCPFVSVYDGEQFQLQGELFGGAINPKLERPDYLPLRAMPVNGEFQVRLSNELKEKQYTNFADLLVIEHPANTLVFPNSDGKIFQVADPVLPVSARLNEQRDVLKAISRRDEYFCGFDDTTSGTGINELNMTFNRKADQKQAKLLLHLKNSYWLDYLYGEFTRNFGSKYENWKEKQKHKSAEQMVRWTEEQNIPLTISMKTKTGWKEIQKLKTIGPLANRNIIIPIETETGLDGPINIKLTTGFMFWEIDYAAMDFSIDEPLNVVRLKPESAEDGNGKSVVDALTEYDNQYLSQPQAGSYAILKYKFNQRPKAGNTFSVVFHTSGYYEPIREFTGKPDLALLKRFREPGYMPKFSLNSFEKISAGHSLLAANNK